MKTVRTNISYKNLPIISCVTSISCVTRKSRPKVKTETKYVGEIVSCDPLMFSRFVKQKKLIELSSKYNSLLGGYPSRGLYSIGPFYASEAHHSNRVRWLCQNIGTVDRLQFQSGLLYNLDVKLFQIYITDDLTVHIENPYFLDALLHRLSTHYDYSIVIYPELQ